MEAIAWPLLLSAVHGLLPLAYKVWVASLRGGGDFSALLEETAQMSRAQANDLGGADALEAPQPADVEGGASGFAGDAGRRAQGWPPGQVDDRDQEKVRTEPRQALSFGVGQFCQLARRFVGHEGRARASLRLHGPRFKARG